MAANLAGVHGLLQPDSVQNTACSQMAAREPALDHLVQTMPSLCSTHLDERWEGLHASFCPSGDVAKFCLPCMRGLRTGCCKQFVGQSESEWGKPTAFFIAKDARRIASRHRQRRTV